MKTIGVKYIIIACYARNAAMVGLPERTLKGSVLGGEQNPQKNFPVGKCNCRRGGSIIVVDHGIELLKY